jgi:hypothetical protein
LVMNRALTVTHQLLLKFLGDLVVVEEINKERKKERKTCIVRMKESWKGRKKRRYRSAYVCVIVKELTCFRVFKIYIGFFPLMTGQH